MSTVAEKVDSRRMQRMFGTIAPRYDFITRAFSFGMDAGWKRKAVEGARLPVDPRVLDLACGTGDFARLVLDTRPSAVAAACDLTWEMLPRARERGIGNVAAADAMRLPFPDHCFDAVFAGYGLRNFPNLPNASSEILRVLKPGGVLATLDFFLPENRLWRTLYLGYLYVQGAFWGWLLHRNPKIYTYIPDSICEFTSASGLCQVLAQQGFHDIHCRRFVLGGIALHWARA
jgi:demethylmenaquinone methyltransferase/2-methoxy-6-polyprenyl-1,4-benzoquinol methylase